MPYWLILSLGIAIVAAAAYVVLSWPSGPPPLDEIGAESRGRLEHVLRNADPEAPRSR